MSQSSAKQQHWQPQRHRLFQGAEAGQKNRLRCSPRLPPLRLPSVNYKGRWLLLGLCSQVGEQGQLFHFQRVDLRIGVNDLIQLHRVLLEAEIVFLQWKNSHLNSQNPSQRLRLQKYTLHHLNPHRQTPNRCLCHRYFLFYPLLKPLLSRSVFDQSMLCHPST